MRLLACDDDNAFLDELERMVARWARETGRVASIETCDNGDDLLAAHAAHHADAVILDMIMPLLDGMDTARELRRTDTAVPIVFLTSSPEFALESYEVKAFDYLLKPLSYERLAQVLEELSARQQAPARELVAKTALGFQSLRTPDIEYAEARNKHVIFRMRDGHEIEAIEPFRAVEDRLAGNTDFFKCHRSYLVNLRNIDHFNSSDIVTRTGAVLPLARSCRKGFQDAYFAARFSRPGR